MKNNKEAFEYFDEGQKGYLTSHELKCCVVYLTGTKLSKIAARRLRECKKEFSFQDLIKVVESQIKEDKVTEIFNALDINQKGYLTFEDFNVLCDTHAKHMKTDLREMIFKEVDGNEDGIVTLRDIQKIVKLIE
jgi:Ca2+-binding EF-hand superfamily protein